MKLRIKLPPQVVTFVRKLKPIARHHYFLSSLVILGGMVAAVYVVNETLSSPSDDSYRQEKITKGLGGSFDQATIKKVEALKKSSEQANNPAPPDPGVRTNPFAE
jgi:hypothetical protein